MLSKRTKYSLAQFLALQDTQTILVLLGKYSPRHLSTYPAQLLQQVVQLLCDFDDHTLLQVLREVFATVGNLRTPISPRYRFDERLHDLTQCLELDGYLVVDKALVQTDPSIGDAAPMEDDLLDALRTSRAPSAAQIEQLIVASSDAFRAQPPDYNAALTNARVALETLARDVAAAVAQGQGAVGAYDPAKWGEIIGYLRRANEITVEEEKGLAGVYGFLSPGAHRPVGISQEQMTRLGRSFALNMCWFLLKNRLAPRP